MKYLGHLARELSLAWFMPGAAAGDAYGRRSSL